MDERSSFKGNIGFVLAAAGSAVGLGNIWRFPYFAAKDGGGLFLFLYVILLFTFGFALLSSEITIGRMTKLGPLSAYGKLSKKWKGLGILGCLVPAIIFPYYCAIGGWVLEYFTAFLSGEGVATTEAGYFTGFITSQIEPIVFMAVFLFATSAIVIAGVNKGIEVSAKIMMPILFLLVVVIAIYSLTIDYTDPTTGITRTGLDGLYIYLVPNFSGLTIGKFLVILVDAVGQLFFSLSIAMGIMIAYGSYLSDKANLIKSTHQIQFFDTFVAFFAGAMIIPAVFVFFGSEGLSSAGPGLIFVSLPKVFQSMGTVGLFIGTLFFLMVLFAAITSSVSIMEAVVSSIMDEFHTTRLKACIIQMVVGFVLAIIVCLGYNVLYFDITLPTGATGQILDVMDYVTNSLLMPFIGICTCIMIGYAIGPETIIKEMEKNGESLGINRNIYVIMVKYIAPVVLLVLLATSSGLVKL